MSTASVRRKLPRIVCLVSCYLENCQCVSNSQIRSLGKHFFLKPVQASLSSGVSAKDLQTLLLAVYLPTILTSFLIFFFLPLSVLLSQLTPPNLVLSLYVYFLTQRCSQEAPAALRVRKEILILTGLRIASSSEKSVSPGGFFSLCYDCISLTLSYLFM